MDDEPLLRVMALHALLYCPRLFYLEEVEELRVADHAVYAGRELHAALEADEDGPWATLELESRKLGLKGKLDCVRRRDGQLIPYEHKRGRPWRDEHGVAAAWPSDRVQVAAYALLIEDSTGQSVAEGRVRYHAENVVVHVAIDETMRREVQDALTEARRLRSSLTRPPVTEHESRCERCSLAPVCLPEESRHLQDIERTTQRLFPPEDDRAVLHVLTPGASVGRKATRLIVRTPDTDTPPTEHPIHEVGSLVLHGHAQVSAQAVRLCVDQEIPIHWLGHSGRYLTGTTHGPGRVQRRLRQYAALSDDAVRLRLTKALVHARIQGQHRFLLRATRNNAEARITVAPALRAIGQTLAQVDAAPNSDVLRGLEGEAAAQYFQSLDALLSSSVPAELHYTMRTRRPPKDRFNALLSYGYGLLHTSVMNAVLAVGLEPAFGFFHRPRSAAHPLVLDLMELFRVPLWDMTVIASLNRGQWNPDENFRVTPAGAWLSDSGRRKAVTLLEGRLDEQWKHPVLNYSLSYRRTLELEVRLLEKEWSGEPGLFARARLR